ncbi:MAG: SIMPL domain-containing protein [Candidatus Dormibacteria bacterium]
MAELSMLDSCPGPAAQRSEQPCPEDTNLPDPDGGGPDRSILTFSGSAVVQAPPDRVEVSLTLTAQDSRRERAFAQVARASQRLGKLLDSLEVPKRSRVTDRISVQRRLNAKGRPEDYQARTTMRLRLAADFPLSPLLDRAVDEAGATLDGPTWDLSRQHPSRLDAVRAAVLDARDRAAAAAEALGLQLGPAIEVREAGTAPPRMLPMRAVRAAHALSTPLEVEAGEVAVSAVVEVTFEGRRQPPS